MNVACLVPYPPDRVPSQRFRIEQWARPLRERHGIEVDFIPLITPETMSILYKPGRLLQKSRDILAGCIGRAEFALRRAREYDVVVVFREAVLLGIDWIERLLVRRVPTVFDFDDAVWIPNVSEANRSLRFLKGFTKIDRILGMVSSVSAGCEFLAAHARQFNRRVHIVPTSIDLELYGEPRTHVANDVLTVGWTGSVTTAKYLGLVQDAMQKAARALPMRLVTLGGSAEFPGLDVEARQWTADTEISTIRTFDVGIKPAPREDWARGKCPMKEIQYMALGIPAVAERFGTALESIDHGKNGFLCDTDDDWVDALKKLQDPALRTTMGMAARKMVEDRYSAVVAAKAFAGAVEDAHAVFHGGARSSRGNAVHLVRCASGRLRS